MNGIGGIGKTTLAKYFIDQYHSEYTSILWINGVNGIEKGFVNYELLTELDLFDKIQGKPLINQFNIILEYLRKIEPAYSLLILDNIDKKIEKHLSNKIQLRPNWKVLLTSRRKFSGYELYNINPLPENDCIELFFKNYKKEKRTAENLEIVKNIINAFYRHTLSIELIAKTTNFNLKYSLKSLWNEIKEKGLSQGLEIDIEIAYNRLKDTKTTISKCLDLAFSLSEFNNDKYKLSILSYLSILPPTQIEYSIAKKIFKITDEIEIRFINTLNSLEERGWLENQQIEGKAYIYMHPMIQHTIRKKIKPNLQILSDFIFELSELINIHTYETKTENVILYTPFIENIINIFEREDDLTIAHLCHSYCYLLRVMYGDISKADEFADKALNIRIKRLSHNHKDLVASYNTKAITLRGLGELREALEYSKKSIFLLEQKEDKSQEDYKSLASYHNTQGQIYKSFRTNESARIAISEFEKGLKLLIDNKIPHPHLEATLNDNIGNTYSYFLYQFEKALPFLEKAVIIGEKSNDPHILTYYNNISGCYLDLGKLKEAEEYIEKVVTWYESLPFKDTNLNLAIAYKQYSDILLDKFTSSKNEEDILKALAIQNKAIFIKENISSQMANRRSLAVSFTAMAKIFNTKSSIKDDYKALQYILEAISVFEDGNFSRNLSSAYEILIAIYNDLNMLNEKIAIENKLRILKEQF